MKIPISTNIQPQIGKEIGDVAEETLRFFAQIGVEVVGMPTRYNEKAGTNPTKRPLIPPTQTKSLGPLHQPWDDAELQQIKSRIESFGFSVATANLPLSGNIVLGLSERKSDLEIVKANIITASRVGIPVLTYNFTALRASEGYGARYGGGRGGATLRDFDNRRVEKLPHLDEIGQHAMDAMWERVADFLQAVIPTAEEAGVRLAAHPNDPPVPIYRGVAQPLGDLDGMKRLVEIVDSPSNCVFFDTGVTTEMGEDAVAAIHYFGERDRIGTVHFRNVRVEDPRYQYVETFHDNGDCDMAACMKAFHEVGYTGAIYPDHTPYLTDDTHDTRMGWAFAIGQIIGLRAAVS